MFREYRQIVDRINGLDRPLSSLTRSQRNEVLNLSIRQEELEKQIGEKIRKSFKELQEGLDVVAEWVRLIQEDAIKALGVEGTPQEVLALEETLAQVNSLNVQISALTLANYSANNQSCKNFEPVQAAPAGEPDKAGVAEKTKVKASLPIINSTIDFEENSEQKRIVSKVLEEINEDLPRPLHKILNDILAMRFILPGNRENLNEVVQAFI
ncbi:MAG: hypothetical protein M1489_02890, partial [Firmicutes bacterium]|nr:hypothetical protein [Bacillota bacterium]